MVSLKIQWRSDIKIVPPNMNGPGYYQYSLSVQCGLKYILFGPLKIDRCLSQFKQLI
jgi:hypothetical protein